MKKIIISSIGIAVLIASIIIVLNSEPHGRIHTSYVPLTVEQLANSSDVIVIGRVEGIDSTTQHKTDKVSYPITHFIVDIERVIDSNYNSSKIKVSVIGNEKYISNEYEELLNETKSKGRVLLFLDHADESSNIYGDTYLYLGYQGKFSIDDNNIAHNIEHGDIQLDELVSIIKKARNRL
ncbi:MAG: hypothetical protein QW416_07185 [Candidatus Nitrosocaldaceae archaeon]